jgi:hypothetical protein
MAYQVPRAVWIRAWWKQTMLNRRTLLVLTMWAIMAVGCMFLLDSMRLLAILPAFFLLLGPVNVYALYAKSVDSEPQLTDPKTLQFSRTRLAFVGPDWRNEMAWKRFKGLSEDADYFYLLPQHNSLCAVIPKRAFTPEQQQLFREYAQHRDS